MEIYLGNGIVYAGNALEQLKCVPSNSVDCVITSPPYYLLRKYGDDDKTTAVWGGDKECSHEWDNSFCVKCGAWKGELGNEPDPDMFVKHLADVFDEVKRVMKPSGNCFIVMGDTYAGGGGTTGGYPQSWEKDAIHRPANKLCQKIVGKREWIKRKQLLLIPQRLAIEMQMRGWIIRDMIIWAKKVGIVNKDGSVIEQLGNGMPESVKDRLSKGYEIIIHAVKSEKYYFNKPRTSIRPESIERMKREKNDNHKYANIREYGGGGGLNRSRPNIKHISKYNEESENTGKRNGSIRCRITRNISKYSKEDENAEKRNGSMAGRTTRGIQKEGYAEIINNVIENVNNYLKTKLQESGYTVEDIEQITGIRASTLSHYFASSPGGISIPSKDAWDRLKPVLGLDEYEDRVKKDYTAVVPVLGDTAYACNVLQMNTEPLTAKHYAPFPTKLVRFLISAGCPEKVCSECGMPYVENRKQCRCSAGSGKGVVLDPFMGSGTTAMVCEEMNRRWIGIEINSEYVRIIRERISGTQRKLLNTYL